MSNEKPCVLLIDDEMSASVPPPHSVRLLEKVRGIVAAAEFDLVIPVSRKVALIAARPDLLVLDIDLSRWAVGFDGFKYWELMTAFRKVPLVVLSTQPPETNFFAQQKAKVVWISKDKFLAGDVEFLANQIRSMATDIDNSRLDVVLDAGLARLQIMEGENSVGQLNLEDPGVPVDAPFSGAMSIEGARFHLVRMLMLKGRIESSVLKGRFSSTEQQRFLGAFNDAIRKRTKGRVGYKFIVNENRTLQLKAKTNPSTGFHGRLENALVAALPSSDVARIEGLIQLLTDRVSKLEGGKSAGPSRRNRRPRK